MSSGANERPYLSIGEVLGLLLEEFPDVTISKIRFLESQGLIVPERTSSGYRKFFDADIDRLRVILREQRENFLPLRVIRDRLENGAIDESGAVPVPLAAGSRNVSPLHRGIRNVAVPRQTDIGSSDDTGGVDLDDPTGNISLHAAEVASARHPAAQSRPATPLAVVSERSVSERSVSAPPPSSPSPSAVYVRADLCSLAGITPDQLTELESFGIVSGRGRGSSATYTDGDLAITRAAAGFLLRGIDARHLRSWRQAAEREAGLFEQRVLPLLRQRNPQARAEAVRLLADLADLGADLRHAIVASSLSQHLDP